VTKSPRAQAKEVKKVFRKSTLKKTKFLKSPYIFLQAIKCVAKIRPPFRIRKKNSLNKREIWMI